MPELEEGNLWIRATLPRTVSLEEAARIAPKLRDVIASVPEVRGVMSHVGPARRRHRRDQLLQPGIQRPPQADGAVAEEGQARQDR